MNDSNLIPLNRRTQSERKEIASMGAAATNEIRRRKRDMKALASVMLSQNLQGEAASKVKGLFPDLDGEATMAARIMAGQINAASKGNTRAAQFLADLQERGSDASDRPPYHLDALNMTTDCIAPYRALHGFYDGNLDMLDMVFKGGRGGIKSSFASELAYETMLQDPNANVVFGRRFKSDLKDSVYTTFLKVIAANGATDDWEITKSPPRCTYKPTGTSAYFFGFDNAEQLKSFTPEVGYVKLLVFEEADEMLGNEQMDSAADTFLRSNGFEGARQLRLKVFNPPASKSNFMNEWVAEHIGDPDVSIFDFCYTNVPREWLGEGFLLRAEKAKREKPEWYRNNYLGEVTGEGGELFSNVEECELSDDQVAELESTCYQGLDFGYEHPMVFIRVHYDPETDTVTPLFEHVQVHAKLSDFLKSIDKYKYRETICDSAEPDRIDEMLEWDWDAVKAVKRWKGGGRSFSWEWLRQRSRIRIDPSRTPHLAHELRTLEFEKVKGGYSSRYPDLGEDCVMATIYALNRVIRQASVYDAYE